MFRGGYRTVDGAARLRRVGVFGVVCMFFVLAVGTFAAAMPAQVMIIRHAEKFEDRHKTSLSARGKTRAAALAEFFRSDPRVLEYGVVGGIIAQHPTIEKKSVRCEETVQPLAQCLGYTVIDHFAYGQVKELVEWLKRSADWDTKSVLVCAQHADIVPMAKAFGVQNLRLSVWPHETYDRVWILDFSLADGKLEAFRDIEQNLLFGDSFQSLSSASQIGSFQFTQTYSESYNENNVQPPSSGRWTCKIEVHIPGDFSQFDDETIPMLRLGGFTFGYHATSIGKLKQSPDADVTVDEPSGSGSMNYYYKAKTNGEEQTYALVSFNWNRTGLNIKFDAAVDESNIRPNLSIPVECPMDRLEGMVNGATNCYVAFGNQRFYAPVGLPYNGVARCFEDASRKKIYEMTVKDNNGFLIRKSYLPEL